MVDVPKLRAAWNACGIKYQKDAAKAANINEKSFSRKHEAGIFGSDEIERMIIAFKITDPIAIFFPNSVT